MAGTATRGTGSRAWTGWVLFAALMMVLAGGFNVIQGLVALFNDDFFVVRENALVIFDFTAWGWITLLLGVFMIVVGLGLNGARGWARIIAVGLVGLNAIAQLIFVPAYPVWSMLMIGLDVVVIYALIVRWEEVVAGMDSIPEYRGAPQTTGSQLPPLMPRG